ncbi:MAG TPA: hypothetical protein VGC36_15100 [Rhizomicrobium sp.]
MTLTRVLIACGLFSTLFGAALASPNLLRNPNFAAPSSLGTTTSFTATDPAALGGGSAAADWTIWAGVPGGRVMTSRTPTGEADGGYMLDVLVTSGGYGLVQAFLAPDHGPSRVHACIWLRMVSGSVGVGVGNGGDTHPTAFLDRPGSWTLLGTVNGVSPANELIVYRTGSADAEFQVRSAAVSEGSIPCGTTAARPETHVKPEPYPWTLHPEQSGVVQPANPAQGGANANGYFENMQPANGHPTPLGTAPAQGQDHEEGHGHDGGKGGGKGQQSPLTQPGANQIQQPPAPATK